MYKKFTVTIGVPAHNEAGNIGNLIDQILHQKQETYILENIIIASDNSNDETIKIVSSKKSPIIKLINGKVRIGKSERENEIINMVKSDILIFLDADIWLDGNLFIEKLIKPIIDGADLASCRLFAVKPQTLMEKVLIQNIIFQDLVISKFSDGDNVYTCHGTSMAMSRRLYSSIVFPDYVGEDAYTYFYSKRNNFIYKFVKDTTAYIRLPTTLSDHLKQSKRFIKSREIMFKEFEGYPPLKSYNISLISNIKDLFKSFTKSPVYFSLYLIINTYSRLALTKEVTKTGTWEIASSSKSLN